MMSKRARLIVGVAVTAAVLAGAVWLLWTDCYPVRPGSDAWECKARVAHYLGY